MIGFHAGCLLLRFFKGEKNEYKHNPCKKD